MHGMLFINSLVSIPIMFTACVLTGDLNKVSPRNARGNGCWRPPPLHGRECHTLSGGIVSWAR